MEQNVLEAFESDRFMLELLLLHCMCPRQFSSLPAFRLPGFTGQNNTDLQHGLQTHLGGTPFSLAPRLEWKTSLQAQYSPAHPQPCSPSALLIGQSVLLCAVGNFILTGIFLPFLPSVWASGQDIWNFATLISPSKFPKLNKFIF